MKNVCYLPHNGFLIFEQRLHKLQIRLLLHTITNVIIKTSVATYIGISICTHVSSNFNINHLL
jgi:hypothetical protein